jgi:K+/H+ antiporter YhaU regulatory subunit KhtT
MVFNPSSESKIELGDTVVALGEKKDLIELENMMGA